MLDTSQARATASIDEQHDLLATAPTTTPLPTPWGGPAVLLHLLHSWVTSWTRRHPFKSRRLWLDLPRGEAPTGRLVPQYASLYVRPLSGRR